LGQLLGCTGTAAETGAIYILRSPPRTCNLHLMPMDMTDPSAAMISFQEALDAGLLPLRRGRLDEHLYMLADDELGVVRYTFVRLQENRVVAFANFVATEPYEGSPCLQMGYAVPEDERGRGLATDLVRAAINELQANFANYPPFVVEAVVGVDNVASQKVAARTLTEHPSEIVDQVSDQMAYQYVRKVETLRT